VSYAYLRTDGTAYVVWGSAVAGLAAYAYQLLGGRVLGPDRFAPVSVLLTIHFLTFIVVLLPIEQLLVRRLTLDPYDSSVPMSAIRLAAITILGATAVAAVGADRFLAGDLRFIAFAGLTVATHVLFVVARGTLAGRRRFRAYGLASGAASVARLVGALAVTAIRPSATGFALALIAGPLVVLAWRPFRPHDQIEDTVAEPSPVGDGRLLTGLVLAAAASQALLLAGPLLVGLVGGTAAQVSIAFAAFTLGRAPLVFGYNLLARVLPPFTRLAVGGHTQELVAWARGMGLAGLALSGVGALAGWALGPWLVRVAFGPGFELGPAAAAVIAAGVVFAGTGLFVGQVHVARGHTGRLAIAWSAGLAGALVALAVASDVAPIDRVAIGFLVGEVAALVALVVTVDRRGDRSLRDVAHDVTKRTLDIGVALVLLVLAFPVLLVAGIAVRLETPGPVFFRQERVGRNGRPFRLLKLRTMVADADEAVFAEHLAHLEARPDGDIDIADDERTTRVGRFLRRWAIDELPNLWNVLRGQMSLVGPRPLVAAEAALVGLDHPRFSVKPGVTGLAQVRGRRATSFEERNRWDEAYVAAPTIGADLRILAATLGAVARRRSGDT
ncbi:MAG: sugar transferase, partial [Acidimicrobiia bacterium]